VIGRTPFDLQIWVNPQERIEFVERLQAEGAIRNYEVHFRCKDGTKKFGLASAELIEINNEPCILSVIADVTEGKRTQKRLRESQVGCRLIEAHEQERTWIAGELHNDINQRLALLAIELEKWKQSGPQSVDFSDHVEQARKRVFDISKDVQALSHRLHSSKLE